MKTVLIPKVQRLLSSGVFVSGPNGSGEIEGPLEVMFAGLVGAAGGFVAGLLLGACARLLTMDAVRGSRGGAHWAAYGAGAGAVALSMIELFD